MRTYTNVFIRYIITVILFAFGVPCDRAIERPKGILYGEEENTHSGLDSPAAGAGYLINRNISGAKRRFRFTYLEAEGAAG